MYLGTNLLLSRCLALDKVAHWKVSACLVAAVSEVGILYYSKTLLHDQTLQPDPGLVTMVKIRVRIQLT